MKKQTQKTSFCALMCGVSLVLLAVGGFISSLDLTAGICAGLTVSVVLIECGVGWAFMLYGATCVLGFLLIPNITPPLFYALMGGIYPIIKSYVEQIKSTAVAWAVKIIGFNLFYTGVICVGKLLLDVKDVIFTFSVFVYVLGNVTFIVYDIAFTQLITYYLRRFRRNLK